MGKRFNDWQNVQDVLLHYSRHVRSARKKYRESVQKAIGTEKHPELTGGGLIRSMGRAVGQERIEIWMAFANMELLTGKEKTRWADILVSEISESKAKPQHFWALSRICARELLYGPVDRVIPPGIPEKLKFYEPLRPGLKRVSEFFL